MKSIGVNISALRRKKGITQEELAKNVGVSAQAVSKWGQSGDGSMIATKGMLSC